MVNGEVFWVWFGRVEHDGAWMQAAVVARSTSQRSGNNWQREAVGSLPRRRHVRHVWVAGDTIGGVRRSRSFNCGVVPRGTAYFPSRSLVDAHG